MKHFTMLTFLLLCLLISHTTVYAQCECSTGNCDFIIDTNMTDFDYTANELKAAMGVSSLAGKRICIKAGTYTSRIVFRNVEGTSSAPITIKNCDGKAIIDASPASAILLWDAKYIRLLGNSCAAAPENIKYGIRAKSGTNYVEAKALSGRITDIEMAFLEIGGDSGTPGSAGIKIIDDPGCDEDMLPRGDPQRWVMRNILVHDNYIHNVGTEGMYIGKGQYFGAQIDCNGSTVTSYSVSLRHVRIYNNIVRDTGWDGIQLKDADEDVQIYNNTVSNYGILGVGYQNEGFVLGTSVGDVYHNKIINGTGSGMFIKSLGNYNIHNNIIANSGEEGMYINGDQGTTSEHSDYFRVVNNTIAKTGQEGIWMLNSSDVDSRVVVNNIVAGVNPNSNVIHGAWNDESNNLEERDATQVGFVDYQEGSPNDFLTNDYHLQSGSPAVDAGKNASVYPIPNIGVDYDGEARNQGNGWDIGAYEFDGTGSGGGGDEGWEIYINSGGVAYTEYESTDTTVWEGDQPGHATLDNSYNTYATGSTAAFGGPNATSAPNEVLGTYRYTLGSGTTIRYNIPVPAAGDYEVELFFARKNGSTHTSGDRRFNIFVEGQNVATYDVYDEGGTGGTSASSFTYSAEVVDNALEIKFVAVPGGHAQINAIYVKQADSGGGSGESIDLFITSGGFEYEENEGGETIVWEGDQPGHDYLDDSFNTYATGSTAAFGGPNATSAPDEVIGTYRYTLGSGTTIRYDIPVPGPGDYDIELFFARKNADTYTSGARRFNIVIEGQTVTTYDVYDEGGSSGTAASSYTYSAEVTDNSLEIKFVAVPGAHAQINAIHVNGPVQGGSMMQARIASPPEETVTTEVYPNPTTDYVDLNFSEDGHYNVRVMTAENEVYMNTVLEGRKGEAQRLDLSGLRDSQMFFIHVESTKGKKTYRLYRK
jgi:hypothetical protein